MRSKLLATIAVVGLCSAFAAEVTGAEPNKAAQDPQAVLTKIKLRQLTQQFSLTPEQQTKCQTYLNEQATQIAAVQKDTTLPLDQKLKKQDAIAQDFKGKIKLALNDEQRVKWDEAEAKAAARKKRNAASAAAKPADKVKAKENSSPEAPAAPAPEKKTGA